ncbi:ABC transporter permease [Brachybacterium sp.]|uniref:ABC transporter permease n=1 Tax=Brachybacterium sp. TaxID=1891286 RepID=UPI002ED13B2A
MNLLRGEALRLLSTRLPRWTLLAAVLCGAGLTALLALIGPENATPPMPGLENPEGAGIVLGLGGMLLVVPALIGTTSITGEYRHRTIGTTFLATPRRGRVLCAKLAVFALLGLAYGLVASLGSGLALLAATTLHGQELGIAAGPLVVMLAQLAVAAAVHMVLGVAIGALARHQLLATGIVLGCFYLLDPLLMVVPGLNQLHPLLPGGATAALTRFNYLGDAIAEQTGTVAATASPALGATVLLGWALLAAVVAVLVPLRRDLR